MKRRKEDLQILTLLTAFSLAFIIAAFFAGDIKELVPGLIRFNISPSQLTMDYFKLGGLGASFLNTGLVGLICCALLFFSGAACSGLSIAAYWLCTGFATFGMTFLSMWPFILGAFIYSRIKKVSFGSVAHTALFSTALAPFAGELMLRYPAAVAGGFSLPGLLAAALLGIVTGCVMPALCSHSAAFHKGYDLYNAGPAAGFLAFFFCCLLYRSPGIPLPSNTDLGEGCRLFVTVFFFLCFTALIAAGLILDRNALKKYKDLLGSDGYQTDFISAYGFPVTLVNMGLYGLFILLYYSLVRGAVWQDGAVTFSAARFTGATMGSIMCMHAFSARGAHPRNVFPMIIGYVLASLLPLCAAAAGLAQPQSWCLTTQSILVGLCFASGLAPVAGRFGFGAGVLAGVIHVILVTSVPLLHGGFCLYNGGFTAGITAFLLVPVLEDFRK